MGGTEFLSALLSKAWGFKATLNISLPVCARDLGSQGLGSLLGSPSTSPGDEDTYILQTCPGHKKNQVYLNPLYFKF